MTLSDSYILLSCIWAVQLKYKLIIVIGQQGYRDKKLVFE